MLRDVRNERVSANDLRHACAELERRLSAGEACTAEAVFAAYPELTGDAEAALEVIYTEFVTREQLGQQPSPADFYARFPQWRDGLEQLFQIHLTVGANSTLIAGARSGTPFPDAYKSMSPADPTVAARRIGNYELLGEIGRGGMGVVYKARQIGLNRLVALKMILTGLDAGPEQRAQLRSEAEAVARLHHPNIVEIYEIGEHDGRPFLSLEYVDGGSLEDALAGAPWPALVAARLVETLARAIHHAHEAGIVHRDLKPANVLISDFGLRNPDSKNANTIVTDQSAVRNPNAEFRNPKITDFGFARRLEGETGGDAAGLTRSGAIVGTPAYMAPEQAAGDGSRIGPAADVYALGAILYELLTGHPPFQGVSVLDTLEQVRAREPLPPSRLLPGLPRDLETIGLKCLRKEPGQRYATAAALADDLGRFLGGESIHARPARALERAWRWARRRPAIAALLAALVVTVAAGFAGITLLWRQTAASLDRERNQKHELESALASKLVALAQRDWMANDLESARRHLHECPQAHRGADWRYLHRVCNACLFELGEVAAPARSLAWSADGHSLASTHAGGTFAVWDLEARRVRFIVNNGATQINQVAFNSDGQVVSVSWLGTSLSRTLEVKTRDLQSGRELSGQTVPPLPGVTVTLSSDGRRIALTRQGKLSMLDIPGAPVPTTLVAEANQMSLQSLSPDGRKIAWLTGFRKADGKAIRVWDTATEEFAGPALPVPSASVLAFSPDGSRIAVTHFERETGCGVVRIWDYQTGREIRALRANTSGMAHTALCFSPDGRRIATCSELVLTVWDLDTAREVFIFRGHAATVLSVAFSADGARLASGGKDGTIRIWDVRPFDSGKVDTLP